MKILLDYHRHSNSPPKNEYRSIAAFNVVRGEGDLIASLDLKIGGLVVRHITVRRGRKGSTYVNFPRIRSGERWIDAVEVTSESLLSLCHQVALAAALEVNR